MKRAITHILKIRNDESFKAHKKVAENKIKQMKKCSFKKQRVFVKPVVDYNAESYVDMIRDWDVHALYEPPSTKRLSFVFALISMLCVMSLREPNESEIIPVKIEWYESLSEFPFTNRKNNHSSNAMSSYLDFHP